ncbi:MAG: hypothetical protein AB7O73_12160, partial [Bacteroidia bacterium]
YLKNVAFCVTNGNAPNIKAKAKPDIYKVLAPMTALTIKETALSKCLDEIKKLYISDMKVINLDSQEEILFNVAKNILSYGYVNAIDFWIYLKENPKKFLKVQKTLDQNKENYSFVFSKNSNHKIYFDEFFKTFKTSTKYRLILERYIGGFMTQNLAIK